MLWGRSRKADVHPAARRAQGAGDALGLDLGLSWSVCPDALALSDAEGTVLAVNQAYLDLFGLTRDEAVSQSFAVIFPEAERAAAVEQYKAVFHGDAAPPLFEAHVVRTDGSERVVEARIGFAEYDGQRTAMLSVIRDVTTRAVQEQQWQVALDSERHARIAAEALAGDRALYQAAVADLAEGLALVGRDERVVFWNTAMERLSGVPADLAVGALWVDATRAMSARTRHPSATLYKARAAHTAALAGRPTAFECHIEGDPPRDLRTLLFAISGAEGLLGHGWLVRDVTTERNAERGNEDFVSVVLHELRTTLTSILSSLKPLPAEDLGHVPDEQRDFLAVVARNAERLRVLVDDLLDLSRIESGRTTVQRVRLDVPALIGQAVEMLQAQIAAKGQTLTVDIGSGLPDVWGDPVRVLQVLTNLVGNASRYTDRQGSIVVRVRAEPDAILIDVQDTGVGMSAEQQTTLFTEFFRVDDRSTEQSPGTGLSLMISRVVVEAHGGTLTVESEPGVGSTFRARLPTRKGARS